jgi:hypothetical protein
MRAWRTGLGGKEGRQEEGEIEELQNWAHAVTYRTP